MATVVLISDRVEDLKFAQDVAAFVEGESLQVKVITDLKRIIKEVKDPVFFWDVDHKNAIDVGHPMSIGRIGQVLEEYKNPRRVFVLSDNPLNKTPFLFNLNAFSHNIVRQYDSPACAKVVASAIERPGHKVTVDAFLNDKLPGAKIEMRSQQLLASNERPIIVGQFQRYLGGIDLNPQIASLAVQGADELMMNAIFDAPCKNGNYYRRKEPRNSEYPLLDQERVAITYGVTDDWVVFSAKDQFGSVRRNSLLGSIRRDYEKLEYTPPEDDHGAGLGIYGIIQGGLSITFTGKANESTEVTLLVPRLKSFKAFRTAFRFFCFYC